MSRERYPQHSSTIPSQPADLPKEAIPALAHLDSRTYLRHRGLSDDEIESYQLHYCAGGEWRRRVIIPFYRGDGTLLAFQGRHLDDEEPRYRTEGARPIFVPYTWHEGTLTWEWKESPYFCVVEGPFDTFSVQRICPAVAILGDKPSDAQLQSILAIVHEQSIPEVTIWLDKGAETERFSLQLRLQPYVRTRVIFSQFKDPGECTAQQIRSVLDAL